MKTYICHYPKLKERLVYLIPALYENNINDVEVVNGISRYEINESHKKIFSNDFSIMEKRFNDYNMPKQPKYDIFLDIEKPVLANFLTHIDIWTKISHSDSEYCLVLEDDAVIANDFKKNWNRVIAEFPNDLDIAYLHDGCGFTVKNKLNIEETPEQIFYRCPVQESRTCCSYIISKSFCDNLLKSLYPIIMGVDHEMNYLQRKLNANVYWTAPVLFHEGSGTKYNKSYTR